MASAKQKPGQKMHMVSDSLKSQNYSKEFFELEKLSCDMPKKVLLLEGLLNDIESFHDEPKSADAKAAVEDWKELTKCDFPLDIATDALIGKLYFIAKEGEA